MSKNHSGRPLNVNHHVGKMPQLRRVASRMEPSFQGKQSKKGKAN